MPNPNGTPTLEELQAAAGAVGDFTPAGQQPMRASTGAGSRGTGFISLGQYLGLNRNMGQAMARGVANDLGAKSGEDPFSEKNAERARLAGSPAGVGTLMGDIYGRSGPYTSGMSGFDAALAGAAGGQYLQDAAQKFGTAAKKEAPAPAATQTPPDTTAPNTGAPWNPIHQRNTWGRPMWQRPALQDPRLADVVARPQDRDPKGNANPLGARMGLGGRY